MTTHNAGIKVLRIHYEANRKIHTIRKLKWRSTINCIQTKEQKDITECVGFSQYRSMNEPKIPATATAKTSTKRTSKKTEAMKIPAFLNCSLTAKAKTVLYDNLTLKDCAGKLIVKDQTVTLQNVITSVFGGPIGLNGMVSTKEKSAQKPDKGPC